MASASDTVSEILIHNLHCDSCVRTIEKALSCLSPQPLSFQISIVSRLLTVHRSNALSAETILATLEESGFDVAKMSPDTAIYTYQDTSARHAEKHRKHMQQCYSCMKNEDSGTVNDENSVKYPSGSRTPSLVANNRLTSDPNDGPFVVTLSVGGMTCSTCSNTITSALSEIFGVSEVVVGLLDNSVTAIAKDLKIVDDIVRAVEDCGFEAQIANVEPIKSEIVCPLDRVSRVVSLRVDGMFCPRCPEKVTAALNSLGPQVTVLKSITTYTDPILTLSYQPSPPSRTIRTIISTISNAKTPPFNISIHKPIPIEERARNIHIYEQRRILFRLVFSVVVAIPTFIIAVVYMSLVKDGNRTKTFLMEPMWSGNTSRAVWALFFMATPVMFYSANLFHQKSIKEIRMLWRRGSATPILNRFIRFGSMNLLVSSGVSVAYLSSVALLGLSALQPTAQDRVGDKTTYFDSVVFLTMFLLAGRFMEAYSKGHTAGAITALRMLRPAEAFLLVPRSYPSRLSSSNDLEKGDPASENMSLSLEQGTTIEKVIVDLLEVGDIVRVQNGSTPPCDGKIVSVDNSAFDESSLTGESRLIEKQKGDMVYLGTINKSRVVDIQVDAVGGGTMLDQIIKVVRQGQIHRAPIERVADILTGYFVPVITLLAIITWVVWLSLGVSGTLSPNNLGNGVGGWYVWSLEFAIAVFVVACPCGIGLAAPTAFLVGSGLAAKFGILARGGGEAFQEMAQLDIVVFDKTGTLTMGGAPRVSDFEMLSSGDEFGREVLLAIATEIESTSSHPLAIAIRHFCDAHGTSTVTGSGFTEVVGRGLKAYFETLRCTAIIGNEAWVQQHDVVINHITTQQLEGWKYEAKSVVLLALRDESRTDAAFNLAAIFAVTDPLRPEAKGVVRCLQEQGVGTWMISGDNVTTAKAVAKTVGIPESNVIASVLPHEKAEKIQWLQQVGSKRISKRKSFLGKPRLNARCIVAMVGDGINDAPALTAADIGIAIGSGSDVAISSASFILVSSNFRGLITLSDLSRKVFNRVKFNFLWAILYNLVALPVAAGVLYPAGRARLDPVWASLAMALSSVSVVCSSLLLKLYKEPKVDSTTA